MKKVLLLLTIVAIVGASSAFAQTSGGILKPDFPRITSGIYDRNLIWPSDDTQASVQMPRASKAESRVEAMAAAMFITGTTSNSPMGNFKVDGQIAVSGISALNARGSTMMTPKQRADREIRKLLRQLD